MRKFLKVPNNFFFFLLSFLYTQFKSDIHNFFPQKKIYTFRQYQIMNILHNCALVLESVQIVPVLSMRGFFRRFLYNNLIFSRRNLFELPDNKTKVSV